MLVGVEDHVPELVRDGNQQVEPIAGQGLAIDLDESKRPLAARTNRQAIHEPNPDRQLADLLATSPVVIALDASGVLETAAEV